jgi:branched-chain amino acid transport system ATP-binding protein
MNEPLLAITNLTKNYGALAATDDFSMQITPGHLHALIGPNGAGKTTLVNQLSGDLFPDKGSIRFNGRVVTHLPTHRRARLGIARSFQITHIFTNMTVEENMGLALCSHQGHSFRFWRNWRSSGAVRGELEEALAHVDLLKQAKKPAAHLSHGEKRQLEVGMALTGKPKLLILDEPMAGMGPGGTVELSKLINKIRHQMTILLVEHDMNVVFSLADQITVMVYGRNLASGSPEEIRNNPEVRTAYLGDE